jgi:uncharacterized ParB-like nuclease family protein
MQPDARNISVMKKWLYYTFLDECHRRNALDRSVMPSIVHTELPKSKMMI